MTSSYLQARKIDGGAYVPTYSHPDDAGADLHANHDAIVFPGERAFIRTGIAISLPRGHVGFVCSRSGMAMKHGVAVLNDPGVIDAGYRGEIGVTLINTGNERFVIGRGDRIAQLVIQRVEHFTFVVVEELNDTARGENGFGSTGSHLRIVNAEGTKSFEVEG